MHNRQSALTWCVGLVVTGLIIISCSSPEAYKQSADEEVGELLRHKQKSAFGSAEPFSVEWKPASLVEVAGRAEDFDGSENPAISEGAGEDDGSGATGDPALADEDRLVAWDGPTITLNLRDALFLANHNSWDYQSRKEDVYLSALSLTLERHRWDFIPSASIEGAYTLQDGEEFTSGGTSLGLTKLLSTGGSIGLSLGTNFLRFITGESNQSFVSAIGATITQPLLRGAGRTVALEALTQAERNTVYELRDFRRFQQTFAVSVASSFFRVLQQKDTVANEVANYKSLQVARARAEAMADAGRLPEFEVDQARQDELRARDRWISSVQGYEQSLDNFKITLGLRTDANIELDSQELELLSRELMESISLTEAEACQLAYHNRLDYLNTTDEVGDAQRKVEVAKDGFLAQLDLVGGADFGSDGPNNLFNLVPGDGTYSIGFDLDLPLDLKAERNIYRQSLITLERTRRRLQEDSDRIQLDIRDSFRNLDSASQSYEIQKQSVTLASRRVESTELLLQKGDATTRDLLESQSAFLEAKNAATRALIAYRLARQDLYSDMGILEIDAFGMLGWPSEAEVNERLQGL